MDETVTKDATIDNATVRAVIQGSEVQTRVSIQ